MMMMVARDVGHFDESTGHIAGCSKTHLVASNWSWSTCRRLALPSNLLQALLLTADWATAGIVGQSGWKTSAGGCVVAGLELS
jgi:hypothetical protein